MPARGFEPETFRAADVYATSGLRRALSKLASIALFMLAPYSPIAVLYI